MDRMAQILSRAFKNSEFGFFIVPDRFDVLSRSEVREWLDQMIRALSDIDELEKMR